MSSGFLSPAQLVSGSGFLGLRPEGPSKLSTDRSSLIWSSKTISNGSRVSCMKTWNPINNKKFEVLSYLPPLTEESIAKEVDYMISKKWIPCLEFDEVGEVHRTNSRMPGYYDGRYWTLWKLPMFGCTDSSQVLHEIEECKKAYPNAYIRLLSFNNKKQCQCMSFVIQKPNAAAAAT
ncbi:ribulose bisphosphate carboxylase small subunit, chloroplastic-like [Typha angustifolia]|uniref:ribulose bisphosphate carboxylase small subunit, chloroplastic-like n=1 Tax=Typha angustifolia TaxID=59011 RepID=UPI003C2D5CE4